MDPESCLDQRPAAACRAVPLTVRTASCADSTLPAAERRNYKGVGDAFVRIVGEDGVAGLFRGAGPTIVRAMSLNMGMFAANEQVRPPPPGHAAAAQPHPSRHLLAVTGAACVNGCCVGCISGSGFG